MLGRLAVSGRSVKFIRGRGSCGFMTSLWPMRRMIVIRVRSLALVVSLMLSGQVFAVAGDDDESSSSSGYRAAVESVEAGRYQEAADRFGKVVKDDPSNPDAWNYLGYSYRHLNRFGKSLQAYERAIALAPKHRGAHEYLGELYLKMGELDKAKAQLETLDNLCFFSCAEFKELKRAIERHEAG